LSGQSKKSASYNHIVTIWDQVLETLRAGMPEDDFRRWFGATAYASDSGDQITVWVPSEAIRRHLDNQYQDEIKRAVTALGRAHTNVRLVVSGFEDDELVE
jgi:chromosomal replication initiation ATPase DnaA